MRTFRLNKLIRDGVFDSMLELGQQVNYKQLNKDEYIAELTRKLSEEVAEFDPKNPKATKELADLLEVIDALAVALGLSPEHLKQLQSEIRKRSGGFEKRIFVETVGVPDGDEWADYYAKEPDRFPEI